MHIANTQAISYFQKAREHYIARRFKAAHETMQRYRQTIDYCQFEKIDHRASNNPKISIIIVSFKSGHVLLECIDSVFRQQGPPLEVILIDNGGNQNIHAELFKRKLLWIKPPLNLFPSEGRNVGAYFARSDLLFILDDDARMVCGHLMAASQIMTDKRILGVRGRVLPKNVNTATPQHYDLGNRRRFAEFNFEGNMAIRTDKFHALGGFDPLMFGHEGKELTQRAQDRFPDLQIIYDPALVVQHDWAQGARLAAKRERQAIGMAYLKYLKGHGMSAGITILIRAGDSLIAFEKFIESLIRYNTYKPVEVLLWTPNIKQALSIVRTYVSKIFVRVLPAMPTTLGRISQQLRYDNLLILDLPIEFNGDLLPIWLKQGCPKSALLCSKQQLNLLVKNLVTTSLEHLVEPNKQTNQNHLNAPEESNELITKPALQTQESGQTKNIPVQITCSPQNQNKNIKLSVIIPVFNKVETIKRTFDSILAVNRDDIECIFIDDFSTDGSRKLIGDIKEKYKNIVCIFNENNIGAGASRNLGIDKAIGEYVFFLDADDSLAYNCLPDVIQCADKNKADLVRGKVKGVKSDGTEHWVAKEYLLHQNNELKIGARWREENSLWFYWYFYSNLYRRSFLNKNYIRFPEGVRNEDPIFLAKCFLYAKNIILYPLHTYIYTVSEDNHRRSGRPFLNGWVYGYYSIYQLICSQRIQKSYFLCHFPSLERHCNGILETFDEKHAIELFNCISVMFRTFEDDAKLCKNMILDLEPHLRPWEKKDIYDTIDFGRSISGKSATDIYKILRGCPR